MLCMLRQWAWLQAYKRAIARGQHEPKAPDVWAQRVIAAFNVHDTRKLAGFAAAVREIVEAEVRTLAAAEQQEPTDSTEIVGKALGRAFSLGQTYWQQADSESYKQNKKAGETQEKYEALRTETLATLAAPLRREQGEETAVLPPLPNAYIVIDGESDEVYGPAVYYSEAQMHTYARAALAGVGPRGGTPLPLGSDASRNSE